MNKLVFLKGVIKNLVRFHPRYFLLFRKNKTCKRPQQIRRANIFVITSCINTYDNNKYINHNPRFLPKDRLNEALIGLKSVRDHYPDRYIIFLESSRISNEDENKIRDLVDEYHNYSESGYIKIARQHYNKGVPQYAALVKFIEENHDNFCADIFHFLGARYILKRNITNELSLPGAYFLYYQKHKNVSTRYFFLRTVKLSDILGPFRKTLYCALVGNSVEDVIYSFFREVRFLDKLDISGKVNGVEMINE